MFDQLLKLCKNDSLKTPLEDFTTEAFVGILKLEPIIKAEYISKFLKLPPDKYQIKTQVYFPLKEDNNNYVDVVIEGDKNICFIENKVNSKEGVRQLERYSKVLDQYREGKETRLFYCTKYHVEKKLEEDNHRLKLLRWFEIAIFLKAYEQKTIVSDFLKFLKKQKMSQELNITSSDFIAFENIQKVINLVNDYLEMMKPDFKNKFAEGLPISDGRTLKQIRDSDRFVFYIGNCIEGEKWTDMKYGFFFSNPSLFVDIYFDKDHEQHDEIIAAAEKFNSQLNTEEASKKLGIYKVEGFGSTISMGKDLVSFINNDKARDEIKKWFEEAFTTFEEFQKSASHIKWKQQVLVSEN